MSMRVMEGLGVSGGVAIGRAVCVEDAGDEVLRFHLGRADIGPEIRRFEEARDAAFADLSKARVKMEQALGDDMASILEAQALLLNDKAFARRIVDRIRSRQVNAEWAVARTCNELEIRFAEIESEYLRERSEDLRNVSRYLLRSLQGIGHHELSEIEGNVVLVGKELAPSDALRFSRENVVGFALEVGGKATHTTIIARGLNLPMVVNLTGILELATDQDPVIIDGDEDRIILHPTPEVLALYEAKLGRLQSADEDVARQPGVQARTGDGVEIELLANLELVDEIDDAIRFGCCGVGLYRSEFFFIEKSPEIPTEEEHFALFSALLEGLHPRPVTVRTFDLGGRQLARELFPGEEENPVLGLRGIRLTRLHPEIMRSQLRALYRAAVKGDLRIMIPLVSTLEEVRFFKALCTEIVAELAAEGLAHDPDVRLGAMIEVPGAALLADHFAREVDFLSIGTNDLIQYSLAVDRNNEHVAELYQPTHPAVLRLLKSIVDGVAGTPCELSLCGEMASDPLLTPFLLGIGLRRLSMGPRSIPVISEKIGELQIEDLGPVTEACLALQTADEVRELLAGLPSPSGVTRA